MKTLDEVINIFEKGCDLDQRCKDCSGCLAHDEGCPNDGANAIPDALYYLKMYRSDMQMYAENQKFWEDELAQKIKDFGDAKDRFIAKLKELDIGTLNEPLTWDELKQMEGKPVWVEGSHGCIWGQKSWALIRFTHDGDMLCLIVEPIVREFYIGEEYYGTDWQAFQCG